MSGCATTAGLQTCSMHFFLIDFGLFMCFFKRKWALMVVCDICLMKIGNLGVEFWNKALFVELLILTTV